MWIDIQEENQSKSFFKGWIKDYQWEKDGKRGTFIPKKIYLLYLYVEENESDLEWEPMERDDILILELQHHPPKERRSRPPSESDTLILRVRFQVDNDGILSKKIRWRFQHRDTSSLSTWRLPLRVGARLLRQGVFVSSLPLALLAPEIYERTVHSQPLFPPITDYISLLRNPFSLAALILILSFILWLFFDRLWTSGD